jgi:hypothetical protein
MHTYAMAMLISKTKQQTQFLAKKKGKLNLEDAPNLDHH